MQSTAEEEAAKKKKGMSQRDSPLLRSHNTTGCMQRSARCCVNESVIGSAKVPRSWIKACVSDSIESLIIIKKKKVLYLLLLVCPETLDRSAGIAATIPFWFFDHRIGWLLFFHFTFSAQVTILCTTYRTADAKNARENYSWKGGEKKNSVLSGSPIHFFSLFFLFFSFFHFHFFLCVCVCVCVCVNM